jgi:hypothetical protein
MLQAKELKAQRQELKASVEALTKQAAEAEESNKHAKAQLEFAKEQAVLANARAEEAQRLQREMSEAALAETQRANVEQVRGVLRTAYADWLANVELYLRTMDAYALWLGRHGQSSSQDDQDETRKRMMGTTLDDEVRAFMRVRLADTDAHRIETVTPVRHVVVDREAPASKLLQDVRNRRHAVADLVTVLSEELAPSVPSAGRKGEAKETSTP